jgi:hypothetical protein
MGIEMNIMYHHVWISQYTLVESTVGFLFAAGHGSSWTVVNAQMDHDGPLGINMGWPEDIVTGYLKIEYSSCSLYKNFVFGGPHCIDTAMKFMSRISLLQSGTTPYALTCY